jgi:hypothetical protein
MEGGVGQELPRILTASEAYGSQGHRYLLPERICDLFLEPRRLFAELRREPRVVGATLFASAGAALTPLILLFAGELDVPFWALALTALFQVGSLWLQMGTLAFVGMALGGLLVVGGRSHPMGALDLSYSHWFALAAHCSGIWIFFLPLQLALVLWTGALNLQPNLAAVFLTEPGMNEPGSLELSSFSRSFLSHLSLRSAVFVLLFGLGASVYTGVSALKTICSFAVLSVCVWFILSWFTSCAG